MSEMGQKLAAVAAIVLQHISQHRQTVVVQTVRDWVTKIDRGGHVSDVIADVLATKHDVLLRLRNGINRPALHREVAANVRVTNHTAKKIC